MKVGPSTIILVALVVLVVATAGAYQFYQGVLLKRAMIEQSADDAERRARRARSRMDVRLRRTRRGQRLAVRLQAAGVSLTVLDFMAIVVASAVAGYLLARLVLPPLFSIAAGGAAVSVCFAWLRRRQDERREAFVRQLPDVARVLSNAASAGLALRTAIPMAADELTEPAKTELRRTADALGVGQSLEDALRELEERMPSRELAVLVTTLVIQARAGGALVSALRGISETLDARKELRREVQTVMSGSVFNSYIAAFLGVVSLLLLNALSPTVLDEMVTTRIGIAALTIAGSLYTIGFILIRRMTRIEV